MPSPTTVKLIVLDIDGVLTDGAIYLDDRGVEAKRFYVRDGLAIKAAQAVGLKVGVITGRSSPSVTQRMIDLEIGLYFPGSTGKAQSLDTLCAQAGVTLEETAYLGDDLPDLPAMTRCGYPMAVADASPEARAAAQHVTRAAGGHGAVREAIEHILRARGLWDEVIERFGQ